MKKKAALLFFIWFLILECLAGCARQGYSCFMEVGDYEISKEEYALLAYDNIARTAREYGAKEGIDVNAPGFWEKKTDGVSPMDRVRELTDGEAVQQKGIQILAKENGIIDEIGYEAFLKQYQEENKQRKQMKEEGKVLYGPLELTVSQYYSYRQSQLEQALEEFVEQKIVIIGEEELKEYYPVVKQMEEKKNFRAQLSLVIFEDTGEEQKAAVEQWIAVHGITDGLPVLLAEETGVSANMESLAVDTLELGKENLLLDRVVQAVKEVEAGEVTPAIEYRDGMSAVIAVESKEYVPFGSYDTEQDYVEYLLRKKKAREYIADRISGLEVKRGKAWETITYEDIVK
ncbi:hypothetical protein DFR60_105157 [Hungatella effluvii]|uniref:Uncharacterized protein n=1 Tax=Hungatella effluvii TaxID=1096246 RepID=A0A2V3Y5Q2_9FIRM|nr:hypothetical protein [Hungatella effluvii]PXX53668.1 hypothetical protein DFR60_105157 [Hungatella effluvii]